MLQYVRMPLLNGKASAFRNPLEVTKELNPAERLVVYRDEAIDLTTLCLDNFSEFFSSVLRLFSRSICERQ